jgi:hypothetical protein
VRSRAFLGTADAQRVLLRLYGHGSLDLMVVPSELDADSAARAMQAAASPANRLSALALIDAAAEASERGDGDGAAEPSRLVERAPA